MVKAECFYSVYTVTKQKDIFVYVKAKMYILNFKKSYKTVKNSILKINTLFFFLLSFIPPLYDRLVKHPIIQLRLSIAKLFYFNPSLKPFTSFFTRYFYLIFGLLRGFSSDKTFNSTFFFHFESTTVCEQFLRNCSKL